MAPAGRTTSLAPALARAVLAATGLLVAAASSDPAADAGRGAPPSNGASYYSSRPDDPRAVEVTRERFGARGDGVADDTAALQKAIDAVQEQAGEGVVLLPEGRYRLTAAIHVWPGIRVVGFGPRRPTLVLGPRTPGYGDPGHPRYLVFFAGRRPADPSTPPPDANPGTFYSALSNVDLEIGEGNPGAAGVRARYAQHSFTSHVEFRIGSGLAGIHEGGNVAEDVRFVGGEYGIWTGTPSPGWPYTILDARFEGQRRAAVRERAAGLTLIRPWFRRVPTAVEIEDGQPDDLFVKDARLEDVSGPAFVVSLERSPRTQVNVENAACRGVATFALLRESGRTLPAPGPSYVVRAFSHGLRYADLGSPGETGTVFDATTLEALPPPVASDLPPLPPVESWANARDLGAKGDGATDDTSALRAAIAGHRAVFLPAGHYVVTDTLSLRPDSVLVGLHPDATQLVVPDRTPAFQGVGAPKALLEAPKGGETIVIGIGLYTNGANPRAVAAKWMAGARSMMNDVRFLGGHGTAGRDGRRENRYNNAHSADPDLARPWDSQYPSLWVTDGGGGAFVGLWTPSTFAQAGLLVSDTTTSGRVYGMSSEHHVRHEVQIHRAANWELHALQTEEERGESGFALPVEIRDSSRITISNLHAYRVISSDQPYPWAVKLADSSDVRFRGFHMYSNSKASFDAAVVDDGSGVELRQREFAWLDVSGRARPRPAAAASKVLEDGASVERLASGFHNASGGAVSPLGDLCFVDARWHRIYRWSVAERRLTTVADAPTSPVNLAFDASGNLIVVSSAGHGTVYVLPKAAPGAEPVVLAPQPAAARPGATAVLPVGDWRIQREADGRLLARPHHFLSPDGTTFLPATQGFVDGVVSWGVKSSDLLRSFGLQRAKPGERVYLTSEAEVATWSARVGDDGSLEDLRPFAERGGEGVAVDAEGRVFVAAGDVLVYDPSGALVETLRVPSRPTQVVFGGRDRRTLFLPSRGALYAVRVRVPGR